MYTFHSFNILMLGLLATSAAILGASYFFKKNTPSGQSNTQEWIGSMDFGISLLILTYFGLNIITRKESSEPLDSSKLTPALIFISQTNNILILLPILSRWYTVVTDGFSKTSGFVSTSLKNLFIFPLIAIGSMLMLGLFFQLINWTQWIEKLFGKSSLQETVQLLQTHPNHGVIAALCTTVIIFAPLIEEIIFRGYLLKVFTKFSNQWVALVWQALFFAFVHFNALGFVSLFILGLILGYSYLKTKSLWTPIITHALFNATTVVYQLTQRG